VTTEVISFDLKTVMRRLKLSRMLDTLPERLTMARAQQLPHQDFLLLVLSDEATRRDGQAAGVRALKAALDPAMQLEASDDTAKVTFDRALLNELVSLRFIEAHAHVAIIGPCGVGKTFLAHAFGHIAGRRGYSVLATRADQMLKTLKHARLDNSHESELRRLISVDLLIVDDFGLDAMDVTESRDAYEILTRAPPLGLHPHDLKPRPRRVAPDVRRPDAGAERDRPLHRELLRPHHRGRVVPTAPEAARAERRRRARGHAGGRSPPVPESWTNTGEVRLPGRVAQTG
jgi:DNA replication protein DnaC